MSSEAGDYRPCVAILLFNRDGRVLVAERNDVTDAAWQLPQGGIDAGETPAEAALREMEEEIGTRNAILLRESEGSTPYDLPDEMLRGHWRNRWRGQRVKCVCFLFQGTDAEINLATEAPEFRAWRWAELEEIPALIVDFKKPLYETAVREFSAIRDRLRAST